MISRINELGIPTLPFAFVFQGYCEELAFGMMVVALYTLAPRLYPGN